MKKTIRVGIFGAARGSAYYSAIDSTPGFCVAAVCDQREETLEQLRPRLRPDVRLCRSFDGLLEAGLDAVILANYFHEHAGYAIRAMEAGLDVISETTAAPTPCQCLALLETAERTGRRYMLAANCPTMVGPEELARVYQRGELGEVLYAEAEYLHDLDPNDEKVAARLFPEKTHWRRYLPGTYYNMHSLGVLMSATGLSPRRVTAMEICTQGSAQRLREKANPSAGGIALYEMSNGAVFRSTGCCSFGPDGKWYRLSCEGGTVETLRIDQDRVLLRKNGEPPVEYAPAHQYTEAEKQSGHGGADSRVCQVICRYLAGTGGPALDVYQAVELSLAGIYGLYSILEGRTYQIPDPRDRAGREILRGDDRNPFPDGSGKTTLPCSRFSR